MPMVFITLVWGVLAGIGGNLAIKNLPFDFTNKD